MSNSNSKYIKIQPPYTLDKWKDGAAQTRGEREFQDLINYIPYDGGIYAREGILPITYTAQIIPVPTFDPPNEVGCYVVLDFEDGNDLGRNISTQEPDPQAIFMYPTSTVGPPPGSSEWSLTDYKEGTASLLMEVQLSGNRYGLYRPIAELKTWMPGAIGSSVTEWLITGWFKATSLKTSMYIYNAGVYGIQESNYVICYTALGGLQMESRWYDQTHATWANTTVSGPLTADQWYFFGTWADNSSRSAGLYIYDDVTKVEYYTALTSLPPLTKFYEGPAGSYKTIGGNVTGSIYTDGSEAWPGRLDYITMWGILPSADVDKLALIKQIRDLHKAP